MNNASLTSVSTDNNELSTFLSSLIQSHLQPVLDANTPAHFELSEQEVHTFLELMHPEIVRIAKDIYYRVQVHLSISQDDLIQEGLVACWQALRRHDIRKGTHDKALRAYCLIRIRGAIIDFIRKEARTPVQSLDAYLEIDTPDGTHTRELPDIPPVRKFAAAAQRKRLLAAIHTLTTNEKLAILSAYGMHDYFNRFYTPEEVKSRMRAPSDAKHRALRKLASILV